MLDPWEAYFREREAFEAEAERIMNMPREWRRAARRKLARKHGLLGPDAGEIRRRLEARRNTHDGSDEKLPF